MFSDQQAIQGVIVPVKTHQTHRAADGYDNGSKIHGMPCLRTNFQQALHAYWESTGIAIGCRTPGAFDPIINPAIFSEARGFLQSRTINKSDEEVLDRLRALLAAEGRLSLSPN